MAAGAARWPALLALLAARTAMAFQFQSTAAVGPQLMSALAIDYTRLGTLVGAYMLPGVVIALPGGMLGRRFGDRQMVVVSLALLAISGLVTALAEGFGTMLAGRLVGGVGAAILNVLVVKMVADWFAGAEIATAMAVLLSSWPAGLGLAMLALGPLASAASVHTAMLTTTAASLAALVAMVWLYRTPPGAVAGGPGVWPTRREVVYTSLSGLVWTLYNVGFIVLLGFGPSFLVEGGTTPALASALFSLVTWVMLPALPLGGWLADRLDRHDLTMAGCFVILAVAFVALVAGSPIAATLILIGIVYAPAAGSIMRLPTEVLRPEARAVGMGIHMTWYYAGMALLPAFAGWTGDLTTRAATPLLTGAAFMLAANAPLVGFRVLQRRGVGG